MPLELAEVVAGLPMALSFAVAGGFATLREGRRRTALNEAMHELRRPLQALALSLPADPARAGALESSLRMAAAALERLDREVNGEAADGSRQPVEIEPLLRAAVERWRPRAARFGGSLRLRCDAPGATVFGDPLEIAPAVDNLISNAIEHGDGEVVVAVREIEGRVRLSVLDGAVKSPRELRSRPRLRARIGGRCRHGHGLRVVERVAREHRGTFRLRRTGTGTEARLELPAHGAGAGA